MLHHCLIITFSWVSSVSLQYVNESPSTSIGFEPVDTSPYTKYNSPTTRNDFETQSDTNEQIGHRDDVLSELQRQQQTSGEASEIRGRRWATNLVDVERAMYLQTEDPSNPFLLDTNGALENSTANEILDAMEKRYFSPWGGKRNSPNEHMWTWKRSNKVREPSMPKRVRFSPWGGKRSGQMVYKPGSKNSRIIFSSSIPELTRIVSNLSPSLKGLNYAGFQFIPIFDKRHPINILALSTKEGDRKLRDALPFKTFLDVLPKMFKPGHPYSDVSLKKDGKRKVKFSAWGGKRSPPIIGPIWTPATEQIKDTTLDTIILLRNDEENANMEKNEISRP